MYFIYIRIYPIAILPDKLFQVEKESSSKPSLIAGAIKKIMESNAHPNNYHS
jgi:hypothetical protein